MAANKVCILGFSPHHILAPFDDPSWEIWGQNQLYAQVPRMTRLFEMHNWSELLAESAAEKRGVNHIEWMQTATIPIYMQAAREDIPQSITYPIDQMVERFFPDARKRPDGLWDGAFFKSSVSYMLALAIAQGATAISIYGVDMASDTEYGVQNPSAAYFVGVARGAGIKVFLPAESDLLRSAYLYGYEDDKARSVTAKLLQRKADLEREKALYVEQLETARAAVHQYSGALQDIDHTLRVIVP